MTMEIMNMVKALIEKAKRDGIKSKKYRLTHGSSLHKIIRTPEQAQRFMKDLKEALQEKN
jgi:hypothetical protein